MTWSIVAHDPASGAYGVAVTTKAFAVGALCPFVMSGVGALATQALVNQTYGPRGLRLLAEGVSAPDVLRLLLEVDAGREVRQVHLIDTKGNIALHTGSECIDWCGGVSDPSNRVSVAGNMLAGPQVVEATLASYAANLDRPFGERMLMALEAGQAVGGDKRGKQSAALIIHSGEDYPALSLRVDDHAEPLEELRRLYGVSRGRAAAFAKFYATRDNPSGIWDRSAIEAEVQRLEAQQPAGTR